jgi:hypothetical protein
MIEMLRALEENKTLLSLNIGNNKLETAIGTQIRKMLEKNHTIIDLEIGFNNFSLEDVSTPALTRCRRTPSRRPSCATSNSTTPSGSRSGASASS